MFYLVQPSKDFKLLGTHIVLDSDSVYCAIPASNQPPPVNQDSVFIIYSQTGGWEVNTGDLKYCMGFLLEKSKLSIVLQTDDETEMFEQLQEHNS